MFSEDVLVPFIVFAFVFGPMFYLIYAGSKLIRYRIDRKYAHENKKETKDMRAFMERTELRLQALEEIVSDEGVILDDVVSRVERRAQKQRKLNADFLGEAEPEAKSSETEKEAVRSKLRNQLKS